MLVVSVMHESQARNACFTPYQDGILTSRGTFQKYYGQEELQTYIESTVSVDPVPVSLGVFTSSSRRN